MTENYFTLSKILRDPLLAELPAVTTDSESLSYAELSSKVDITAEWLSTQQPKMVALHAENSIDWVVIDLACQIAGICCIPLPDYFSHQQSLHCIADAGVDLLISDSRDLADQLTEIDAIDGLQLSLQAWELAVPDKNSNPILVPEHTQKITYTSGSTGNPKGVCLSTNQQWQVAQSLASAIAIDNPKHLCLLPLGTLLENAAGIYAPLLSGGNIVLVDGKSRGLDGSSGLDLLQLVTCISQWQPNTLIILPQLLTALIAACEMGCEAPESLRFVAVGGGKVAPELIQQADDYGIPVYEGYGLSECCSVVSLNTPKHNKPGTVGKPLPHCRVSTIDGEIHVEGASHLGYLGDPDSWNTALIATGDLGHLDKEGYLIVNGRRKNLLISSFGRNISPEWVESALMARPLFTQCIVVGDSRPHLTALVSTPDHVSNENVDSWIQRVNSNLPDYARVKSWEIIDKEQWQGLFTANGRPRRDDINRHFAKKIDELYSPQNTHATEVVTQ
ncbi:Long-chain acyl-CoA synthetase (AMP-forming) [marine gamma proteobacterium HTCC2143]|uniref:Long-chain acyl-CoA synthetase (AMP-forming) n=1 Tax=marine gamma proteobacterium HTCC2143 TaxID=247633 RepID=A0YB53_9GAMM|nr:Long-chain acyl-CoA synthetase (AMP-forming) [marine gamma proteobacterium HTCC2143]